jgi:hypothetical protein
MARKTALTEPLMDTICQLIAAGNHLPVAAQAAGVAPNTAYNWRMTGATGGPLKPRPIYRRFAERVAVAEAQAESHAVLIVRKSISEGDARIAIDYLRRRHPERWGDRQISQIEHTHILRRASESELATFAGEHELIEADAYAELEAPRKKHSMQAEAPAGRSEASSQSAVERHAIVAGELSRGKRPEQQLEGS